MVRVRWVGIVGAVAGSWALQACADRGAASPAIGCEEYLGCLAESDPDTFEDELATYGTQGTCFDNSDAATCHAACRELLENINSAEEACNPPEPESPDDGAGDPNVTGLVDCADYDAGPTVGPGTAGPTGFPESFCNPRGSGEGMYKCCSDDPAAPGGALPDYANKGVSGGATPYFSGINNAQGTSGMCVRTTDIPAGSGLLESEAANCPIPCNPTWDRTSVDVVCGTNRVCCQTRQLQGADCVTDPETGEQRPVTGADIGGLSDWNAAAHATHQDPAGVACAEAARAAGASMGDEVTHPVFVDCIAQLSVADQRGFCMALGPGQACPTESPSYVSACGGT